MEAVFLDPALQQVDILLNINEVSVVSDCTIKKEIISIEDFNKLDTMLIIWKLVLMQLGQ